MIMRFFDLIIFIFFLSIGVYSAEYEFSSYNKCNEKNNYLKDKVDSYSFIYDSFITTCNGNGFSSLNEWQIKCREMWNLEYIGWTEAEDFMQVQESEKGQLLFGTWVGPFGKGEVYCRSKYETKNY